MTIKLPVVTALNTSTYTAIEVPSATKRSISAYTEDGTSFKLAIDASGTGEAIIPSDASLSMDDISDEDETIFYAKAVTGTPNLVVLWR